MSINWDVPLKNGKDAFFTEQSFNIFNNFITFEEQFLKRLEDHEAAAPSKGVEGIASNSSKVPDVKPESSAVVQIKKEVLRKPATSHNKLSTDDRKQNRFSKGDEAQSSLKRASHITKGRLPPPRKSSLCHDDQKLYLSLYSKYGGHSPADPTEEEITELNKLKVLQVVVKKEQEEYHTYALSLAKALQAEYRYMDASARKYMEARLSARRREVEKYPSHYNIVSSFTLQGAGQVAQLTYIKPLLHLGSVPKMIVPTVTYDRRQQLSVDTAAVNQENPIRSDKGVEANRNHEVCSLDENAEVLAVQHRGHIVVSPGALMCLVDNHAPDYSRGWELPFTVKEYDVIEGDKKVRHRVVYIDKPFAPTNVTERAMNTKFYKFLLRHILCRHHSKDGSSDNSSSVDTASRKTEGKTSKGEGKGSLDKQASVSQLGDIFDIGKDSMEEVETFGTSSFESFTKKKKSEKMSKSVGSEIKTSGKSALVDKVGKSHMSSRKVEQDSFDLFSDQTGEDIETFGVNISVGKSTKQTSSSKVKSKTTGPSVESSIAIETSTTLSTETASPLSTETASPLSASSDAQTPSSPVTSTPSSPVIPTPSTPATDTSIPDIHVVNLNSLSDDIQTSSFSSDIMSSAAIEDTPFISVAQETADHETLETSTDRNVTMETSTDSNVTMETTAGSNVTMETTADNNVTMETTTDSNVTMETTADSNVTMETSTDSNVTKETTTDSNVTMETTTYSNVTMETTADSNGTKETTTDSNVTMETSTDSNVTKETTTDSNVTMETSTDSNVTKETTTDSNVTKETTTDSNVTMETTADSNGTMETSTDSNVTMETTPDRAVTLETSTESQETVDSHIADKMPIGSKGLKEMPYVLIPIDMPTAHMAQSSHVNLVAMDTNSNPNTDKQEHEIIMDAPASPVGMDTPSSPTFTDSITSPTERTLCPKIIPMSVEKHDPQSFHSPDFKSCVTIPLEGEGNIYENIAVDSSQGTNREADGRETLVVSPALTQRRPHRKVRRSTNTPVMSDLDSDDESHGKLLIDVSPVKDDTCDEADIRPARRSQVIKSKPQSKNIDGGKANILVEKFSSFYDKSTNKDGSRSTRVTRSRQSLDTIMAQMKRSSSASKKPQRKKSCITSARIDSIQSSNSSCERKNVMERCTRSRTMSETSMTSLEVKPEVKPGTTSPEVKQGMTSSEEVKPSVENSGLISCDKTVLTISKTKLSVPESDSDSCISVEVSEVVTKDQGSKVKRRSSRLSTGSSSSCLEVKDTDITVKASSKVKDTDITVKASSKVKTSEISANVNPDVKIKEIAALPIVARKRGRPKKILPTPPSGSPSHQEKPRPKQDPTDTEASSIGEDSFSNPIPVKRKRGRPPKQKVEAAGKSVEATNTVSVVIKSEIDTTQSDDLDKSHVREPSCQTKVMVPTAKSTKKTSNTEAHVNRVKPRLVATLIPRTEEIVGTKQITTATKGSGPRAGTKRSSSQTSTFDSILQGMQNMLHTPGQKVTGSQCVGASDEPATSTFKQPDGQPNVSYHLWSLGGFQVVVRCGYHGTVRDDVQKLSKVHLCTKMEYQSSEGLEQITPSETCRSWISGYIRPHCKLLRARIDPLKSELIALEETSLSQLIGSQQTFRPGDAFLMLQNIFHKLHLQPPGQYLLHHGTGDRNCNIKKSTDKKKRGSYDLHFQHFGFMTTNTPNNVPWLPIDPSIILPSHLTTGRVPATFEPADYTAWIPPKKNKGKKKKKQTKTK